MLEEPISTFWLILSFWIILILFSIGGLILSFLSFSSLLLIDIGPSILISLFIVGLSPPILIPPLILTLSLILTLDSTILKISFLSVFCTWGVIASLSLLFVSLIIFLFIIGSLLILSILFISSLFSCLTGSLTVGITGFGIINLFIEGGLGIRWTPGLNFGGTKLFFLGLLLLSLSFLFSTFGIEFPPSEFLL